ncbi:LysR substrate-binding domain-containing protein [Nonomuraea sp. NEAU-A123]|uniref:LysR substrate-binding domain-containing protein n=1 Tax=Nonomuraea sp. NEAU-A123 TaxID=2839649 RepID=UPI001BE3D256|nr:LysR substrate-binding domain-containing protein [Nonomuraea sp. NEAU-A123]MBT2233519.1 hypothetical protein [Nonomuraea sp. NEAU-A123]
MRISLRSGAGEELIEGVRQGTLDVAFLGLPVGVRPKGVHGHELARGDLVAVVAPGHPLAAAVRREVAFEVTTVDFMARLIRQGLGIGMLPAAFVSELPDLPVLQLRDAPARMEHLIWSRFPPSPAAAAFLSALGISAAEASRPHDS